jgi:nucleoside-triphosphatase THEP1
MSSWSVIIAPVGRDKSEPTRRVIVELTLRGLAVGGFLQVWLGDDARVRGWDVERVDGSERTLLARESADPTLCSWAFEPSAFARAAAWAREPADVVIIGGVGKMEAAREGHWPLLASLIADPAAPHVIACVRDSCLANIALELPDPVADLTLPCDPAALESFVATVADTARPKPR